MNSLIEKLSSPEVKTINSENKIIGGIGTTEGRIWVAFENHKVVKKPIISSDQNLAVQQPVDALRHLERGPTGYHDIIVCGDATVELLYCHRSVAKVSFGGNVSLCGRTYVMNSDNDSDNDSGEDESDIYELKSGEHLRLSSGNLKVKVSSAGHRLYLTHEGSTVKCEKFFVNIV